MEILKIVSSKSGDFGTLFFLAQNSFVEVTVDIFLVTKWQKFTK